MSNCIIYLDIKWILLAVETTILQFFFSKTIPVCNCANYRCLKRKITKWKTSYEPLYIHKDMNDNCCIVFGNQPIKHLQNEANYE